jgi:hypothetical protein
MPRPCMHATFTWIDTRNHAGKAANCGSVAQMNVLTGKTQATFVALPPIIVPVPECDTFPDCRWGELLLDK